VGKLQFQGLARGIAPTIQGFARGIAPTRIIEIVGATLWLPLI